MSDDTDWWERTFGEVTPDQRVRWLATQLRDERLKRAELAESHNALCHRVNRAKSAIKDVFSLGLFGVIGAALGFLYIKYDGWNLIAGWALVWGLAIYGGRAIEKKIDAI